MAVKYRLTGIIATESDTVDTNIVTLELVVPKDSLRQGINALAAALDRAALSHPDTGEEVPF